MLSERYDTYSSDSKDNTNKINVKCHSTASTVTDYVEIPINFDDNYFVHVKSEEYFMDTDSDESVNTADSALPTASENECRETLFPNTPPQSDWDFIHKYNLTYYMKRNTTLPT